jgi:hypothetical protein
MRGTRIAWIGASPMESFREIPEWIEGEPPLPAPGPISEVLQLLTQHVLVLLVAVLALALWPLYLLLRIGLERPPIIPRLRQYRRYFLRALRERPPPPGLPPLRRYRLLLELTRHFLMTPLWGLSWFLDDLLFGRALRRIDIARPLFEISAARSGSTQLARYIEDDPHVAAPSMLQFMFPFLWMWILAKHTIGRVMTPERLQEIVQKKLPAPFLQRHEADLLRTDTFETSMLSSHLIHLSFMLGPELMREDFTLAKPGPHQREFWETDFVDFVEAIGRKTLYDASPAPGGGLRTLMIKGHFLAAADALARRYPHARFLTVVREPAPRIRSGINFLRATPAMGVMGPAPWGWLAEVVVSSEIDYCDLEMAWYSRADGLRKCVVLFQDYVRDLEGTMRRVYRECLDLPELPTRVPRTHPPRQRTNYLVDRTLEQLGVDVQALNTRLSSYVRWCRGEEPDPVNGWSEDERPRLREGECA